MYRGVGMATVSRFMTSSTRFPLSLASTRACRSLSQARVLTRLRPSSERLDMGQTYGGGEGGREGGEGEWARRDGGGGREGKREGGREGGRDTYLDTGALAEVLDQLPVRGLEGIHGDNVRLVGHHLGREGGREGGKEVSGRKERREEGGREGGRGGTYQELLVGEEGLDGLEKGNL